MSGMVERNTKTRDRAGTVVVCRDTGEPLDDLYVMQMGRAGPIKIGRSRNPLERQRTVQANSPYEIDTLFTIRGRGSMERAWHRAFAGSRLRGEWFDWTPEVRAALDAYRAGDDWWNEMFPPDEVICEATAEFLESGLEEPFEDAYAECVRSWRWAVEYELAAAEVEAEQMTSRESV